MLKSIFNELLLSILCLFPLTLLCFLRQNIFTTYDWSYGLISFRFFCFVFFSFLSFILYLERSFSGGVGDSKALSCTNGFVH